jgi:hypothetical protein
MDCAELRLFKRFAVRRQRAHVSKHHQFRIVGCACGVVIIAVKTYRVEVRYPGVQVPEK